MKSSFALAFALMLSGCTDIDLFGDEDSATPPPAAEQTLPPPPAQTAAAAPAAQTPAMAPAADPSAAPEAQPMAAPAEGEPPAVSAARSAPAPNVAVSAHCSTLAKLRAGDAAFQGEDPDTQHAVYDRTYADCLAWDSQHRS